MNIQQTSYWGFLTKRRRLFPFNFSRSAELAYDKYVAYEILNARTFAKWRLLSEAIENSMFSRGSVKNWNN